MKNTIEWQLNDELVLASVSDREIIHRIMKLKEKDNRINVLLETPFVAQIPKEYLFR